MIGSGVFISHFQEEFAKFKTKELDKSSNIELSPYIYDMSLKMAASDIVICRAGAATLSELTRLGSVAILIPSPNVTDNHQYKNAKVLADADVAVVIVETELATNSISACVAELMSDPEIRKKMSENIRKFYDVNTEKKIYSEIERLVLEYGKK